MSTEALGTTQDCLDAAVTPRGSASHYLAVAARAVIAFVTPRFHRRRSWILFLGLIGAGVWLNFDYHAATPIPTTKQHSPPGSLPPGVEKSARVRYHYGWPWRSVLIESTYERLTSMPPNIDRYAGGRAQVDVLPLLATVAFLSSAAFLVAKFHDSPADSTVQRRRGVQTFLPRYRLATLLFYPTAIGAWLCMTVRQGVEQRALVDMILAKPGIVLYDNRDYGEQFTYAPAPGDPNWIECLLGEECFRVVVHVKLIPIKNRDRCVEFTLDELERLTALRDIEALYIGHTRITPDVVQYLQRFPWLARVGKRGLTMDEHRLLSEGLPNCKIDLMY